MMTDNQSVQGSHAGDLLRIENLNVLHGDLQAIFDVSMNVKRGQIV
jgi:ABC-type branched-subunit amino acid transport system ATPase component